MSRRRRWFSLPRGARGVEREIDEEIMFHLETRVSALIGSGMTEAAARAQAEREFGDVADARAELVSIDRRTVRRTRRATWLDELRQDVRLAVRGMRRHVGFSAAVVLMLGLGIGATAAMFGIADRLLLRGPAHVQAADEVVRVLYHHQAPGWGAVSEVMPYPDYTALREGVTAFVGVGAYGSSNTLLLGRGADAAELRVVAATASFFQTLGVRPQLGRFYTDAEDAPPQGARVVVLSHELWQSRFGGDPGVLGRSIELSDALHEVIGVAPRGFTGMGLQAVDAWVPVAAVGPGLGGAEWHLSRNVHWLRIVARLQPQVSPAAAAQEASAVFLSANAERFAADSTAGIVLAAAALARGPATGRGEVQRSGRIALWLLGVSGLVLLMVCANVANLLLARSMNRRREYGVRLAMGVGRMRLVRQVLTETAVYACAGAVFGVLLAHWGGHAVRTVLLPDVDWVGSPVSGRVLVLATAVTAVCALLAGVLPAQLAARSDAAALLAGGGRGTAARSPVRGALIVVQAALSVLLLIGAGLFVRSVQHVSAVPLGFQPDRVVSFDWHRSGVSWNRSRIHALFEDGLRRVQAVPGVEAAALTMTEPLAGRMYGAIRVPGLDSLPTPPGDGYYFSSVSPDYFRTLGARIVRGRPFDHRDADGSTPVAVVTETMARLLWPHDDALGRCFYHLRDERAACREVVGVVEDTRYVGVLEEPSMMYYLPMSQFPGYGARSLLVRTRPGDDATIAHVRNALQTLEPDLPRVQVQRLSERVRPELQPWRLGATLFSAFGILALVLAAFGLYSVVTYDVVQRRREFSVRIALGARAVALLRLVLASALRLVGVGVLLGLALAALAARSIEPLLFEVSSRDPATQVTVAALLVATGVAAALLPAWRAARARPAEALRLE